MNAKCHFCGNKNFKQTKVQYIYKHNGKFLIMDDVPCEQCEFCGEQYFEGKILRQIEEEFNRIYVQGKKPIKHFQQWNMYEVRAVRFLKQTLQP